MPLNSRISNFYNLSIDERKSKLVSLLDLTDDELKILKGEGLSDETLGYMIENVVGRVSLPLGIATNFQVNGRDFLVPMAVEESSIVAAASNSAKIARTKGGFTSEYSGSLAIGQMQVLNVSNFDEASKRILSEKDKLISLANSTNKVLVDLGGGARDIEVREIKGDLDNYLVIHLIVDVKDVQGANTVNTMLEKLHTKIEELTKGSVLLKIISNYAVKRMVKTTAVFDKEMLGGEEVVDKILLAYDFANNDVFRCTTQEQLRQEPMFSLLELVHINL